MSQVPKCTDLAELEDYEVPEQLNDPNHIVFVFRGDPDQITCFAQDRVLQESKDPTFIYQECVQQPDGSNQFFGPQQMLSLNIGNVMVNQARLFAALQSNGSGMLFISSTETVLPRLASRNVLQNNYESYVGGFHCQEGTSRRVQYVSNDEDNRTEDRLTTEAIVFPTVLKLGLDLNVWQTVPEAPRVRQQLRLSNQMSPAKGQNSVEQQTLQDRIDTTEPLQLRRQRLLRFEDAYGQQSLVRQSFQLVSADVKSKVNRFLLRFAPSEGEIDWDDTHLYGHQWALKKDGALLLSVSQAIDTFYEDIDYNQRSLTRTRVSYWPGRLEVTPMLVEQVNLARLQRNPKDLATEVHKIISVPLYSWQTNWSRVSPRMPQIQAIANEIRSLALTQSFRDQEGSRLYDFVKVYLSQKKNDLEQLLGPLDDFEFNGIPQSFEFDEEYQDPDDFQSPPRQFLETLKFRLMTLHEKTNVPS